jgi:hypothetical protein
MAKSCSIRRPGSSMAPSPISTGVFQCRLCCAIHGHASSQRRPLSALLVGNSSKRPINSAEAKWPPDLVNCAPGSSLKQSLPKARAYPAVDPSFSESPSSFLIWLLLCLFLYFISLSGSLDHTTASSGPLMRFYRYVGIRSSIGITCKSPSFSLTRRTDRNPCTYLPFGSQDRKEEVWTQTAEAPLSLLCDRGPVSTIYVATLGLTAERKKRWSVERGFRRW